MRALADGESWIEPDEDLPRDLRTKSALLRTHREQVFVETRASRAAQYEALARLNAALLRFHPELYRLEGRRLVVEATGDALDLETPDRPPLEIAARAVQEDLVVMEKRPSGWCLSAGAVCFPTRWDLPSQLDRPMSEIHGRVPGYRKELDAASNRFFDGMKPGFVFARGNWSLMDDPTLFQPVGRLRNAAAARLDISNAGDQVWLRVEHQTLQRLPETGAILFGIRIHRTRLDAVATSRGAAARLLEAIESMPPAMQRYKSLGVVRAATTAYLRTALEAAPG